MRTILITGGTGLIGRALTAALLQRGDSVIVLTREPQRQKVKEGVRYAAWDPKQGLLDPEALAAADSVVHLAGANVASGRWTEKRKAEIRNSRVQGSRLLAEALNRQNNPVRTVVSASATGWYGPDPQIPNPHPFTETDPPADDFLGSVVQQWEEAILPVQTSGRRLTILRTGIVLSAEGGAYPEFRKPLRFGVAAALGNGKQMVSWIHIEDLVRIYLRALENESIQGIYNAVAPHPASNRQLVDAIAQSRGGAFLRMSVPSFALKAALGEMSIEVLKSTTVSCAKLQSEGFRFLSPTVREAVEKIAASEGERFKV